VAPQANGDLLYVSDQGTNAVYVYSYPQGTLQQTLTGFKEPAGECSDTGGDVFISNAFAHNVLEYAHGGTSPVRTLNDSGEFPSGCSVDPVTGNLAVTNYCSGSSTKCTGPGSVFIYLGAKGTPKKYTDAAISNFDFCGYDNKGNLFIDGTLNNVFAFAELRAGRSSITSVTLNQSIGKPGNVQWDGSHIAVGDDTTGTTSTIYQFAISGRSGTKVGTTSLNGATGLGQYWIQGAKVIGPNSGGSRKGTVGFWNYPAGGSPTKTITGLGRPLGATVSV
jgi:hypothetical protein